MIPRYFNARRNVSCMIIVTNPTCLITEIIDLIKNASITSKNNFNEVCILGFTLCSESVNITALFPQEGKCRSMNQFNPATFCTEMHDKARTMRGGACVCQGVDFASVCDLSVEFWNCSDIVVSLFNFICKTCQQENAILIRTTSKTAFATVKFLIDASNTLNTILLFFKQCSQLTVSLPKQHK